MTCEHGFIGACAECDNSGQTPEDPECLGHPAGPYDPMGETIYCDGSCRK